MIKKEQNLVEGDKMRHVDELLDEIIKNYDEETIAHDNAVELKQVLTNCFKVMLKGKDEHEDAMDAKIEVQEEIDTDDVHNGMMLMLNCMISYMPWLQDTVNEYYESEE